MSGNEKKEQEPVPARQEFKALLALWWRYPRDIVTDKEAVTISTFLHREALTWGYEDANAAYRSIFIEGCEL